MLCGSNSFFDLILFKGRARRVRPLSPFILFVANKYKNVNVSVFFLFFLAKSIACLKIFCNFAGKSFNNNQLTHLKL